MIFAHPNGTVTTYDKKHLFRMAGEHEHYTAGTDRVIVTLQGWRINLQICYDLRFPAFCRNRGDYDLLLFVANWPAPRRQAWQTLLAARAIENQTYVVGVNRVGEDENPLQFAGDSLALDFEGQVICDLGHQDQALTISLDGDAQTEYRESFPVLKDADDFRLP